MVTLDEEDRALLAVLRELRERGYRFVTPTPETHRRVVQRTAMQTARDLRGIFGWSLPFEPDLLSHTLTDALRTAGMIEEAGGGRWKSRVRMSSMEDTLFLHSAYPTDQPDSVFLGPDSYRFVAFLRQEIPSCGAVERLVDVGAGAGVGGIMAAGLLPGAKVVLADINPLAIRLARVNAAFANVEVEVAQGPGLDAVEGAFDLAIANPPFMIDSGKRAYRDGGGDSGAGLSLEWALSAARRLRPGGLVLLYTGSAIIDGRDALRHALEEALPGLGCTLSYREIDPDIFGEQLEEEGYEEVERIAAVGAVIRRAGGITRDRLSG